MIVKAYHKVIGDFKLAGNQLKCQITKMKQQEEIFLIWMSTEKNN